MRETRPSGLTRGTRVLSGPYSTVPSTLDSFGAVGSRLITFLSPKFHEEPGIAIPPGEPPPAITLPRRGA
jgi:hypothetical protein